MNKTKKPVEFKDTRMSFSAEYDYSLFVKKRCVFFYCLAHNIRRMINYAENFAYPYRICVIYVYGTVNVEKVQKMLSEKSGNILLLIASDISAEDVKAAADYRKWLGVLKKQGYLKITKQGKPKSQYNQTLVGTEYGNEPSEQWFENHNRPNCKGLYAIYTEGMELIQRYSEASAHISEAQFSKLKVLANFPTSDKICGLTENHNGELLKIIRSVYPYGVEADTEDENAAKMLKIKKLIPDAIKGEYTHDVQKLGINFGGTSEQLCFWETAAGASECLYFLKKVCADALAKEGCVHLTELWEKFGEAPYGAYPCNWYEYIFAYALRDYEKTGYFFGDGIYSESLHNLEFLCSAKCGFIFVQNKRQEEFRKLFAKLFDIEEPPETTQRTVVKAAMGWVTKNIKWAALDCVDHRLYEIFAEYGSTIHQRAGKIRNQDWYEYGYEDKYLPWLKDNFDDLYARIRNLDQIFYNTLAEKYGEKKAKLFCDYYTVKGGAAGWLHKKEDLEKRVEDYMKSEVCCECGKILGDVNHGFVYQATNYSEGKMESRDFTYKDIIGLNKKLIDSNSGNYLCIRCLSEYIGCSEFDLWDKAHDFKEEGCTLFL